MHHFYQKRIDFSPLSRSIQKVFVFIPMMPGFHVRNWMWQKCEPFLIAAGSSKAIPVNSDNLHTASGPTCEWKEIQNLDAVIQQSWDRHHLTCKHSVLWPVRGCALHSKDYSVLQAPYTWRITSPTRSSPSIHLLDWQGQQIIATILQVMKLHS